MTARAAASLARSSLRPCRAPAPARAPVPTPLLSDRSGRPSSELRAAGSDWWLAASETAVGGWAGGVKRDRGRPSSELALRVQRRAFPAQRRDGLGSAGIDVRARQTITFTLHHPHGLMLPKRSAVCALVQSNFDTSTGPAGLQAAPS